jgi:predicted DNA-binding transcriptional regulator AlpA
MSEVNLDAIKLLSRKDVARALGRSTDTLDSWVRRGVFPAPLQAAPGAPKQWRYTVVLAWIEKRQRSRYQPPSKRGQLKQEQN